MSIMVKDNVTSHPEKHVIKDPWIPPPARTTRSPRRLRSKVISRDIQDILSTPRQWNVQKTTVEAYYDDEVDKLRKLFEKVETEKNQLDETLKSLKDQHVEDMHEKRQIYDKLSVVDQEVEDALMHLYKVRNSLSDDTHLPLSGSVCQGKRMPSSFEKLTEQEAVNEIEEQKQNLICKLKDLEENSSLLRKRLQKDQRSVSYEEPESSVNDSIRVNISTPLHRNEIPDRESKMEAKKESNANSHSGLTAKLQNSALEDKIKTLQDERYSFIKKNEALKENRAHLLRELHRREADINRLKVHVKGARGHLNYQTQIEELENQIKETNAKFRSEKDDLEMLLTSEKDKATRNDKEIDMLNSKLLKKVNQLRDVKFECSDLKTEVRQLVEVRTMAESELSILRTRVAELESLIEQLESKGKQVDPVSQFKNPEVSEKSSANVTQSETVARSQAESEKLLNQLMRQSTLIQDLTKKIESQADQIANVNKDRSSDAVYTKYEEKIDDLLKKIQETEKKNLEFGEKLSKYEEAFRVKDVEKVAELVKDNERLEEVLSITKDDIGNLKEKLLDMEKKHHSVNVEAESQMFRRNTEITQLKHEKQEMESRLNSKLSEMNERLEKSSSTNRSLQNYIEFLKNSYAAVYSDPVLSAVPSPSKNS